MYEQIKTRLKQASGAKAFRSVGSESRGTMLAAVFLAQPIGRLLAYGIGLGVLRGLSNKITIGAKDVAEHTKLVMDVVWRLVVHHAG